MMPVGIGFGLSQSHIVGVMLEIVPFTSMADMKPVKLSSKYYVRHSVELVSQHDSVPVSSQDKMGRLQQEVLVG